MMATVEQQAEAENCGAGAGVPGCKKAGRSLEKGKAQMPRKMGEAQWAPQETGRAPERWAELKQDLRRQIGNLGRPVELGHPWRWAELKHLGHFRKQDGRDLTWFKHS